MSSRTPLFVLVGLAMFSALLVATTPATAADRVSGTVRDTHGHSLDAASVRLARMDPEVPGDYRFVSLVTADENGRYTLDVPATGRYSVAATVPGFAPTWLGGSRDSSTAQTFTAADAPSALPDLALARSPRLDGRTMQRDGRPAAGVRITVYRWFRAADQPAGGFWESEESLRSDRYGRFHYDAPSPGSYSLGFDDVLVIGGGSHPTGVPTDDNSLTLADDTTRTYQETLPSGPVASGSVKDTSGPIASAGVELYRWSRGRWSFANRTASTDSRGRFRLARLAPGQYTVRATSLGRRPGYLGGGVKQPVEPSATSSFTIAGTSVTGLDMTLTRRPTRFATKAGQDLAACRAHQLPARGGFASLAIPFHLRYFGTPWSELGLDSNGRAYFLSMLGRPKFDFSISDPRTPSISAYTPQRDQRTSDVISYGVSRDGRQLCVTWNRERPAGAAAGSRPTQNTFQMILTSRETAAGRSSGDFDITLNYDTIGWAGAVGDRSASAGVGYSAGLRGSTFALPGSGVARAFVDGGPRALVAGKRASSTRGRYVFEVRNAGRTARLGEITGRFLRPNGKPAVHASVEVSLGGHVVRTLTTSAGYYRVSGVAPGHTYDVRAWSNQERQASAAVRVRVPAAVVARAPQVRLR